MSEARSILVEVWLDGEHQYAVEELQYHIERAVGRWRVRYEEIVVGEPTVRIR